MSAPARPVVAIPTSHATRVSRGESVTLHAVNAPYVAALSEAGADVVVLPPQSVESLRRLLLTVDGVLLPGGPDVAPQRYGAEPAVDNLDVDTERDDLDFALLDLALTREVPVLGICRGQQVLNVARGGTLVQDIPEAARRHALAGPRNTVAHPVRVEAASRLADALGVSEVAVNSLHHQAIERLGTGLRAVAWAPDGVIEGIEDPAHRFLLAVQFHPEEMAGTEEARRLMRAFVDACATRAHL